MISRTALRKQTKIPSLLFATDFWKAFDSLSLIFIRKVIDLIDKNGAFYRQDHVVRTFGIRTHFLEYHIG